MPEIFLSEQFKIYKLTANIVIVVLPGFYTDLSPFMNFHPTGNAFPPAL